MFYFIRCCYGVVVVVIVVAVVVVVVVVLVVVVVIIVGISFWLGLRSAPPPHRCHEGLLIYKKNHQMYIESL